MFNKNNTALFSVLTHQTVTVPFLSSKFFAVLFFFFFLCNAFVRQIHRAWVFSGCIFTARWMLLQWSAKDGSSELERIYFQPHHCTLFKCSIYLEFLFHVYITVLCTETKLISANTALSVSYFFQLLVIRNLHFVNSHCNQERINGVAINF